ncbi:nuclear transport factor 2 family protein [Mycobacterium sp.]|uniref:nuclear transport factor 2 family protein n=1 Tax=Mycobacterium sp. TaxID=1785 RepID=UPI003C742733
MSLPRPEIAQPDDSGEARAVVEALVAQLQTGWDHHDADITDRQFSSDIAWGSPYGATVHGFDTLYAIHQKLKEQSRGSLGARYEIDRVLPISADVIVAHVARLTLDMNGDPIRPSNVEGAAFSEMAMYVLVRRGGQWWLAAGQNTPIRPGGAA